MNREKLIEAGIDYDTGLRVFGGNPSKYEHYLIQFFEQTSITELKQNIAERKFDLAFRSAHDLKGMSGNLRINRFYNKICELVDILRENDSPDNYEEALSQSVSLYEAAEKAVMDSSD